MSILSMFAVDKVRPLSEMKEMNEMKHAKTHQVSDRKVNPHNVGVKRSPVCQLTLIE